MSIKQERIRELILAHLSDVVLTQVTDPALKHVTITDVKVDREIQYADIYVHALGDDKREKEVLAGFKRASGFLRSSLAKRLRIRQIPVLHFHWDAMIAAADQMDNLLDKIKKEQPAQPAPSEDNPAHD
jgi:ribosome-binding factor A